MKTKVIRLFISLIILLCFACAKDKICLEEVPCSNNEYMPLAIGNYWVYELQNYNLSTYAITSSPRYDTIKVIGDTIFQGHYFYTVRSTSGSLFNYLDNISYLRDSSEYLVNEKGEILFSDSDFDRPLNRADVIILDGEEQYIEYAIQDTTFVRITPAGVFACLDYRGQAWRNSEWDENKIYHNCLAKDIGIVYQSAFYSPGPISPETDTPTHEARRLLKDYYLAD